MSGSILSNVVTGVLVTCAVVVTGLTVAREVRGRPAAPAWPPAARVAGWRELATAGRRIGPDDAPVTIVEFSDFQCPFCRTLATRLRAVRERHDGRVAHVYRHAPLSRHQFARAAAHASECAGQQRRFGAMHDTLFAWQDSLGRVAWPRIAHAAGVADLVAFEQCMSDPRTDSVVVRDQAAAAQVPVPGTPTILINDVRLIGAVPAETLDVYVQRALAARP